MILHKTSCLKFISFVIILLMSLRSGLFSQSYSDGQPYDAPLVIQTKLAEVRNVGIIPFDFDVYHLTAGGIREYSDSLSAIARYLIHTEIKKILSSNKFTVKEIRFDTENRDRWMEIRRFYRVVDNAINNVVFDNSGFPGAKRSLRFWGPSFEGHCDSASIDAVLFVNGFDDRSTQRRAQLKAGAVAGAIAGAVMAALVGVGGYTSIPPDYTVLRCTLVNRLGDVVWSYSVTRSGKYDMTEKEDAGKIVSEVLKTLKRNVK